MLVKDLKLCTYSNAVLALRPFVLLFYICALALVTMASVIVTLFFSPSETPRNLRTY